MPKIRVNGKDYSFTSPEANVVKMVRAGMKLDAKIKELKAEKDGIDAKLIRIANENLAECNTAHLDGVDCEAVVSFGTSWTLRPEEMVKLKRLWGTLKFFKHFKEKTSYSVIKSLVNVKNEVGRGGRGWKILTRAIVPEPKSPSVKYKRKK